MHSERSKTSMKEIRQQFETNFFGAVRLMKAVIPIMRKQRSGIIVNVDSIGGLVGVPLNSAYTGSKFALEGFSESMKYELEDFGIKVILIEPGAVNTNFLETLEARRAINPDSPYLELSKKASEGRKRRFKQASSPMQVAEVILNAIKSEKPNTRYLVGNDAATIMERKKKCSDFELERWIRESLEGKGFVRK